MSSPIANDEAKCQAIMSKETTATLDDPQKVADMILQGINDQSTQETISQIDSEEELSLGVPSQDRVIRQDVDSVLLEDVKGALAPSSKVDRLPFKLKSRPEVVVKVSGATEHRSNSGPGDQSDQEDIEIPISEASEVSTIHHQVKELAGVVKALSRDIASMMSTIETRLSTLESRSALGTTGSRGDHKRVISSSVPMSLVLEGSSGKSRAAREASIKADVGLEAFRDKCAKIKYSPSPLVQRQLVRNLVGDSDLGSIKFPIGRPDWRPDQLSKLVWPLMLPSS